MLDIQKIKEFGKFVMFHEDTKSWVYSLNNGLYKLNKDGIVRIF